MSVNDDLAQIVANEQAEAAKLDAVKAALDEFIAHNPGVDVSKIAAALSAQADVSAKTDAIAADIPAPEPAS